MCEIHNTNIVFIIYDYKNVLSGLVLYQRAMNVHAKRTVIISARLVTVIRPVVTYFSHIKKKILLKPMSTN